MCARFDIADPPRSSPSSILHDLIARLECGVRIGDDDQYVSQTMGGWPRPTHETFQFLPILALPAHTPISAMRWTTTAMLCHALTVCLYASIEDSCFGARVLKA